MSVKINRLELENVKKIKAVVLEPGNNGLTIIGGKNGQGKTSVIDAIAWGLGGKRFAPTTPHRAGSVNDPALKIELSNGLIVERSGKNSDLKVSDPTGKRAGQALLNSFISELALDLPKFMEASNKEKADTLLKIIGVGDQLAALELQEAEIYQKRNAIGQIRDIKRASASEMPYFDEVKNDEPLSVSDLINQQQDILARNGENQRQRYNLKRLKLQQEESLSKIKLIEEEIQRLEEKRNKMTEEIYARAEQIENGEKSVEQLVDESTAELEENIRNIEELNQKIAANEKKKQAAQEAEDLAAQYEEKNIEIREVRKKKKDLLQGAKLPLEGLSVDQGELTYRGYKWDGMSGAEKLKVSCAIVKELKPECGFVLLDKLEQMDVETLNEFGQWAEDKDLQIIATRVGDGGECTIIIEDGRVKNAETDSEWNGKYKAWGKEDTHDI